MWIGEALSWTKKKGRARCSVPHYELVYRDFVANDAHIDWIEMSSKNIYSKVSENYYGGFFPNKHLDETESQVFIKNIFSKNLSESKQDMMWLVSVGRLAVRAVVKWSCFVTTTKCPIGDCDEDETIEHKDVWGGNGRFWF